MFEGFARKVIDTGEVSINCVVGGDGPPVLLLHGNPQNLVMWAKVAPLLAKHFTVVCADLRGYGDSSKPVPLSDHSNYSFRVMASDQIAVMERLGFSRFHVVGHDRGARTAHRMALDRPEVVLSAALLDIAPTYTMYSSVDLKTAQGFWMWFFLARPAPLPERMIGADPDFFNESLMGSLGGPGLKGFDKEQLDDYRRCWRDPDMIRSVCSDYRAAITVDFAMDQADLGKKKIQCPVLAFWGEDGAPARFFDVGQTWRPWCESLTTATLPSGHFFIDYMPEDTAKVLLDFLPR
jgi:haloacetate dehalogenase